MKSTIKSNLFTNPDSKFIKYNLAQTSNLLLQIFEAIPDVIKVFEPNHSVVFFNKAAYDFYDKKPEEVCGKNCYQILNQDKPCSNCPFDEVLTTKQMISIERYYPQANKYMDLCCIPILDELGNVSFIVERLTDVTEKKTLSNLLKRDEKMYREIVDAYPDGIVISQDYKIVLANTEATNLLGLDSGKTREKSILLCFPPEYRKNVTKIIIDILKNKKTKIIRDYVFTDSNNEKLNLQISLSYILYKGTGAILSIIRNTTEFTKSLNAATKIQNSSLQKSFPLEYKVNFEYLYYPAHTVSGDYFKMYKINENLVVGILIDVSGNGITAALNVSAFDVLFLEEILTNQDPSIILNNLNKKCNQYINEKFIAACSFSFNFLEKKATIVGAGINQFIFKKANKMPEEKTVKGPFLGMFENSLFDEEIIPFESGDTFYFFTDGLEFVYNEDKTIQNYMSNSSISEFKNYMDTVLNDIIIEKGQLEDDSSMLEIQIK